LVSYHTVSCPRPQSRGKSVLHAIARHRSDCSDYIELQKITLRYVTYLRSAVTLLWENKNCPVSCSMMQITSAPKKIPRLLIRSKQAGIAIRAVTWRSEQGAGVFKRKRTPQTLMVGYGYFWFAVLALRGGRFRFVSFRFVS
jgi:hypothetical protein